MRNLDPKIIKWEKGVNNKMEQRKKCHGNEEENVELKSEYESNN